MPETRNEMEVAAIGWVIRLRAARAEDWEAFVGWLEADPAHAEIYDEVALADEALGRLPSNRAAAVPAAREPAPSRHAGRRVFLGWGIAAALVGTVGYVSLRSGEDLLTITTPPGERRSLDLVDGSRIDLNGATTVVLDRNRPRQARLEKGEALFTIVHDPARPFGVEAGGTYIKDVGTVFNVVHAGGDVEVAVAEGQVIFNPGREAVSLSPGMTIRTQGRRASVTRGEAEAVGAWRSGRLSYAGASLSRIADDLSRNIGVPVRVDPALSGRRFSGVIVLDADRALLFRRVAALLEVEARKSGDGWILTSAAGAAR